MPKIPTFEAQGRPTAEVPGVKTSFQVPVTNDLFTKAQSLISNYYIKEKEEEAKLKAIDYENKALPKLYEVYDKYKNNPFPTDAADGFQREGRQVIDNFINENLSNENRFVQRAVSTKLGANLTQLNLATIKSSRDAMEKNSDRVDKDWDSGLVSKMGTIPGFIESGQAYNESAEYVNNKYMGDPYTKKIKLDEKFKIIDTFAMVQDSKSSEQFLQKLKENPNSYKNADLNLKSQLILQAQEDSKKTTDGIMIYDKFTKGVDPIIGTNADKKETLETVEKIAMQKVYSPEKSEAQLFVEVDNSFRGVGRLAPSYQSILKQGVASGTIGGKPTQTALKALDIADAADQQGRLDEYTTNEELKFYRSYLAARKILGKEKAEAYEMAVNAKDKAIKLSSLPLYERKRESTLKDIRSEFSNVKSTNVSELLAYSESLFDLYIANGIDPDKAQKEVIKNMKSDTVEIDNYRYLKRDIHPFKSIGGMDEIKPVKEFIIKKYIPDEDPKDFYLKHTGAGTFNIYHRTQMHTYYTDNGDPLIFNYNQMVKIKEEMTSKKTKEIIKETIESQSKKQEGRIRSLESQTTIP
jgi:hypothetical protein